MAGTPLAADFSNRSRATIVACSLVFGNTFGLSIFECADTVSCPLEFDR